MTKSSDTPERTEDEHLRQELLSAFDREGIVYPTERLVEAIAEYAQLQRLIGVVVAAGSAAGQAKNRS